jgi:hypothetical protein
VWAFEPSTRASMSSETICRGELLTSKSSGCVEPDAIRHNEQQQPDFHIPSPTPGCPRFPEYNLPLSTSHIEDHRACQKRKQDEGLSLIPEARNSSAVCLGLSHLHGCSDPKTTARASAISHPPTLPNTGDTVPAPIVDGLSGWTDFCQTILLQPALSGPLLPRSSMLGPGTSLMPRRKVCMEKRRSEQLVAMFGPLGGSTATHRPEMGVQRQLFWRCRSLLAAGGHIGGGVLLPYYTWEFASNEERTLMPHGHTTI